MALDSLQDFVILLALKQVSTPGSLMVGFPPSVIAEEADEKLVSTELLGAGSILTNYC